MIPEGFVFGETNFALGITTRTSQARASADCVTVLEVSGNSVVRMLDSDAEMRARLYFVLCQVRAADVWLSGETEQCAPIMLVSRY